MKKAMIVDCFNHYEYRTKFVREYLIKNGYDVTLIVADFDHLTKKYVVPEIEDLCLVSVPQYKKNLSIKRIISHVSFANNTLKHIRKEGYDLVFCEVPPNILVKKLSKLKSQKGGKLYFDIIDLWPESFPFGDKKILPFNIWRAYRDKWLNKADGITVECDYYTEILKKNNGNVITHLVPLAKPELDIALIEKWKETHRGQSTNGQIVLAYLGSINNLIDIDTFCHFVNAIRNTYEVVVKIIGDGEKRQELIDRLSEQGAKVEFYGKVFDEKIIMDIFADCHMGINLYKPGLKIGMTIKSLDYYRLGIPIINSIPGDTKTMVEKERIGINYLNRDINLEVIHTFADNIVESRIRVWEVFNKYYSKDAIYKYLSFIK